MAFGPALRWHRRPNPNAFMPIFAGRINNASRWSVRRGGAKRAGISLPVGLVGVERKGRDSVFANHEICIGRCGRFFGSATPPAPGSCGIASGSSSQLLLRPLLVVVPQVGVGRAAELGYRHAQPVPMAEELVLESVEESLHRRVVRERQNNCVER